MKKTYFLCLMPIALCLFFISGCQESAKKEKAVEITVIADSNFPAFLVGTWRATEAGWEFKFEPNGTISSAVIDSGMLTVNPADKITKIPLKDGGEGTYKLGEWLVEYTPDNRGLSVLVTYDYYLDMKTYGVKGYITDWFMGPISKDGQYWDAQWYAFPKIITLTPEPSELPIDPNEQNKGLTVFKKLPQR